MQRLLKSLSKLEFHKSNPPDWRMVVVDNDSFAAESVSLLELKNGSSVPIIYGGEPHRGIASARNRAVQLAGDADFIAFIDDDEVADPRWLDELLSVQSSFGADIVNGPVLPRFEEPAPSWIQEGRFYHRRRFPTGTQVTWANTGNVLVKNCWLHAVSGPFEERLNLIGGEDSLFFSKVYRLGAKIVWADEAVIEEYNPPSRVCANWLLKRAFRRGNGTVISEAMVRSSSFSKYVFFLKGALRILIGCMLLAPAFLIRGYAGFIRSLMYVSLGMGEISGLFGIRYSEYKRTLGN